MPFSQRRIVFAVIGALAALPDAAHGDTVTLRRAARALPGAGVTLAQIAELEGPEAQRFADLVVVPPDADQALLERDELTMAGLRAALDRAGANWGRLSLRGLTCILQFGDRRVGASSESEKADSSSREHAVVDLTGPGTVRTRVAALLARLYGVNPDDLRVLFSEHDDDLLNMAEAGRRIDVQPAANATSSRFSLIVWVYEGDLLIESRAIRADVRLHKDVIVLTADLNRGDSIRPNHLRAETMWIEPVGPSLISSVDQAAGSIARRRLSGGTTLRVDHIESPILVTRGDLVTVHCLSGGVVVKAKARARTDGRDGDTIELQLAGSKNTFAARVAGAGRVVVNLDGHPGSGATNSSAQNGP